MKHIQRPKFSDGLTDEDGVQSFDIKKLIKEHFEPQKWIDHLNNDLMKFWNTPEAKTIQKGLFVTHRSNEGKLIDDDCNKYPEEIKAALASEETKGLIDLDYNYVRAHSRQTYAYGIAYNMTGNQEYLEACKLGAKALIKAFDKENGMFTKQNKKTAEWGEPILLRDSQNLAYGITGLGMYYYLTHDEETLFKILQAKEYIFKNYFSFGRGYFTWYPKIANDQTDDRVEIVAQLDQIYAYMIWLTPSLPEPHQSEWKESLKKIVRMLITRFYSERYGFFWGTGTTTDARNLGTDHTDFGHSVKTMWLIYRIGIMTEEMSFVDFARSKIDVILKNAYVEKTGSWARRFNADGSLDCDKEWWGLAELDQACALLALNDPSYLEYLNNTHKYWFDYMVDKKNGEIWHMVFAKDNKPDIRYPKIHCWKTSLHSFEHALFGYVIASQIKNKEFVLHYAFKSSKEITYNRVSPYLFEANITNINEKESLHFMENENKHFEVSFYSLH